jgi:2-phosphosulfolactate phosphatase
LGENGVRHLAPTSDALIIVDVLSFSTEVVVAVGRGDLVYPCGERDSSEVEAVENTDAAAPWLQNGAYKTERA